MPIKRNHSRIYWMVYVQIELERYMHIQGKRCVLVINSPHLVNISIIGLVKCPEWNSISFWVFVILNWLPKAIADLKHMAFLCVRMLP